MTAGLTHRLKLHSTRAAAISFVLALTLLPLASPAAAKTQIPFKATLQAHENGIFNPGPPVTIAVTAQGSGNATHLGLFSYSYTVLIYLNPDFSGIGTTYYDFVAANGDHLYSTGQGVGTPAPGLVLTNHVVEQHIITGGTGRFAGASGQFTVDRLISNVTSDTFGTMDGYIVLAH